MRLRPVTRCQVRRDWPGLTSWLMDNTTITSGAVTSPVTPWSSLSSPDKRPHCLRRRICPSRPRLCRTSSHRRRQARCLPGDMRKWDTIIDGISLFAACLLWMFYRNLGCPDGVWVTVGVVVLLHSPPGYLAVLGWPSAGEIISDGPGLCCYLSTGRNNYMTWWSRL